MRFSAEEKEEEEKEKGEISWFVVGCPEGLDMSVSCASGQSCPTECFSRISVDKNWSVLLVFRVRHTRAGFNAKKSHPKKERENI